MRSQFKVLSDRLDKPWIKPMTPGLQDKWLIHYSTVAQQDLFIQISSHA